MELVLRTNLHHNVAQGRYRSFFGDYLLMMTASLKLHSGNIANIVTTINYSNMYYAM
jgi:hypothetical protein